MREGEYLQIYGDMRKANLLEVLAIIDERGGEFNKIMRLHYVWLDGEGVKDFSSEDSLLADRFHYYRGLYGAVCTLRRDIKSLYDNLYRVYSGGMRRRIGMAKKISARWVGIADEGVNIINCMVIEYKYFNSYFEKHPMGDTLKIMPRG